MATPAHSFAETAVGQAPAWRTKKRKRIGAGARRDRAESRPIWVESDLWGVRGNSKTEILPLATLQEKSKPKIFQHDQHDQVLEDLCKLALLGLIKGQSETFTGKKKHKEYLG